jgi:hypothetical protein
MIVDKIDIEGVALVETKNNPPVTADRDAPETFKIATQPVQAEARDVHIVDGPGGVQTAQQEDDLLHQIGSQFAAIVVLEQSLETAMSNVADHVTYVT